MADYFFPTVVQSTIPASAMTPLEWLLLEEIFTAEPDGDGVYFFAEQSINDLPNYPIDELHAALSQSEGVESATADMVRAEIAKLDDGAAYLQLDTSETGWESIFQDIVRRSPMLGGLGGEREGRAG